MVEMKKFAFLTVVAIVAIYAMTFLTAAITALGVHLGWDPVAAHGVLFWGCLFGLAIWGFFWRRSERPL